MAKYLPLPDGNSLKVPDEMGYEEAISLARQRFPALFPGETQAQKSGIAGALGRGAESLLSAYQTAAGAVTDPNAAAKQALERQELLSKKYAEPTSLERVKKAYADQGLFSAAKEVASQIPGAIAEQVPQMGAVLGGARLGSMAGSLAGPVGTVVGGVAGAGLSMLPQFFGSNIQRQAAEQTERGEPIAIDRAAAAAAAIPQAAVEGAGYALTLGGRLVSKLTGIPEKALTLGKGNAQKLAEERLLTTLAKGTAVGAAAEIPTEIAQQMLERAQAGLSVTDADALSEYGQTAYQVGLLAPLGAAGRLSQRGGARQQVEADKQEATKKAVEAEEAARTQPEALSQLYDQYQALSYQKAQFDAQIDGLQLRKPNEKSTPEDKAAYVEGKKQKAALESQRTEFLKTEFKPVEQEYNKRKGAIDEMFAEQQAKLEAETAPTQPTQAAPIPAADPVLDVQKLMLEQDTLRNQLTGIEEQLGSAAPDAFDALNAQRQTLQRRIDARAALIEERGGSPLTLEAFQQDASAKMQALDTRLEQLNAAYTKSLADKDYEKAQKAKDDLLAAQQERTTQANTNEQRMQALQEKQLGLQTRGVTRELFGGATPVKSPEETVREQEQLELEGERGLYGPEAQAESAKQAFANTNVGPRGQLEAVPDAPKPKAEENIQPAQLQAVETAKDRVAQAEQQVAQLAQVKGTKTPDLYQALDTLNKTSYELSRAQEDVGRPALKPAVLGLFDPYSIMQEALRRGDTKTITELARHVDPSKLKDVLRDMGGISRGEAQNPAAAERARLLSVLEGRLDSAGIKRERADLFSQIYDQEAKTKFKNGTYPNKPLQDLYDKGGVAAVEYEWVLDKVKPLMAKVTTPQGNAKKSLYQQLIETAAEHARLTEQMETGIAVPTMGEKVAGVQAKLGKGEAPAARLMDASERYNLRRKITTLETKYKMLEGKVAPIRDQVLAVQNSLYETKPLAKPSVVKEAKRAAAEAEGRAEKTMSRAAATASRINKGNVRKEAETSQQMRDLAIELGERTPAYTKFEKDRTRRILALEERYGDEDPQMQAYRRQVAKELPEKAMALGKQTPEYKATLKEQVAYFKEVLPTAGKQEVSSKRTKQATRKQNAAPKTLRVAGSKMSEKDVETAVKEANDYDGGTAYRLREDGTESTVDAAEAQKVIDGLKLPENVNLVYAPTARNIPVSLLKRMAAEGVDPTDGMVQGAVFPDGTVLVVGDQHTDTTDLEKTIAHEIIGHYGVDTVIGTKRLNQFAQDTDMIALAEQIGGKKLVAEVVQVVKANAALGRSEEMQKLQALREIIAHTEEARVTESFREKAGRWLKELVGMVRAGLRDMGFAALPRLSTSDVFNVLRQSRKAFANKTIGPYRAADGQTAFRLRREQSSSVVGREPGFVDTFFGNLFGLAGRVQYVDRWGALREALKKGMNEGQIDSLEATNAQYLINFGQHASQYSQQFLTNGPTRLELTKKDGFTQSLFRSTKGVSMVDVAEKLNTAKIASPAELENMFTVYLAGDRAKDVGWEKLNFENPGKAKAEYDGIVAQLNANKPAKAAFENAAKLYKQYNAGLMDWLVQTGVMTPQKAAELKAVTYVPYYRVNKNGEVQLMIDKETPVRISNIKDEPQLQALVGGNEYILPVFTSAVQNTYMITNMGLRNQTVKEMGFLLQKLGIASRIGEGAGPASPDVVRFKKAGKDYHVVIDTDLYGIPAELILKGMEGIKTTVPGIVRLMGYPSDILRKFVTRVPAYAIRQMIRDPLNAWMNTGTDAVPVLSSMKEMASMVAGRNETERKLMETGAISSNVFSGDERDTAKFIKDISAGKSLWAKTLAKADALAMQADAATRIVVYKDSLAKGMSEQEALNRTLESMNFGRRGVSPSMHWLSIMIPFFNAQIQGLDVIYRAYKGDMPHSEKLKIKEKMLARGALLAMGTLAYAAVMEDDEAYKRAKPEERFANWFVYIPGVSEPVRVPIPFELGFLFKALPEAIYGMAANDEKAGKTLKGLGKLLDQTNPFSLPQAVKPLTEVVLGKSFFQGDIESAREKEQLATDRYRTNTTEVAKLLGQATGKVSDISPISIDYLIRGYFGGLGIAIVQLANPILAADQKEIAEPSTKPSKVPLIGGLFQPVEGRGTLDEAYDRMQEIKRIKGSYNKLVEEGKRAEAQEFAQGYANDLAQTSISGRVQKQLGELAKQERAIKASPTMPTEEKDRRLEQLDKMKVQIARQFLALPR
jgi:hypothetical protein